MLLLAVRGVTQGDGGLGGCLVVSVMEFEEAVTRTREVKVGSVIGCLGS